MAASEIALTLRWCASTFGNALPGSPGSPLFVIESAPNLHIHYGRVILGFHGQSTV